MFFRFALAAALSISPAAAIAPAAVIEIDTLNGTYRNLQWPLAPIEQGAFTVTLSSPQNRLELVEHRIELHPAPDGQAQATVEVVIAGEGELIAKISSAAGQHTHRDRVVVPRQRLSAHGLVRLERVERNGANAYQLILVDSGRESVELRVETEIAKSILSLCSVLSRLPLTMLNCDSLDSALQHFQIPLPATGSSLLIEPHQLDPAEIEALEKSIASSERLRDP